MKRGGFTRPLLERRPQPLYHLTRPSQPWKQGSVVPVEKENAWRSESYRRLVAGFACEHCGIAGYSQAAHADASKGLGLKSDDRSVFALCATRPPTGSRGLARPGCHFLIGSTGAFTREQRRSLEVTYATRTINRVRQMGLWPAGLAFPDWYSA